MDSGSESSSSQSTSSDAASSSTFNDDGSATSEMRKSKKCNSARLWRQKEYKRKWIQRSPRVGKYKRKKRINAKFKVEKKEEASSSYSPLSPAPIAKYAQIALESPFEMNRASTSDYYPQSPALVTKMKTESAVIKEEEAKACKLETGFAEMDSPQSPVLVKRFKTESVAVKEEESKASLLPCEKMEEDSDNLIIASPSSPEQEEKKKNVPLHSSNDVSTAGNHKRESLPDVKGPSNPAPKKEEKYFYCEICDFQTSSQISLTRHIGAEHPFLTVALPRTKKEPIRTFQCAICDYITEEKHRFDRHKVHHLKKSVHGCNICNFSADSLDQLGFHLKKHHLKMTKEKPADKTKSAPSTSSHPLGNAGGKESVNKNKSEVLKSGKTVYPLNKATLSAQTKSTKKGNTFECRHCSFSTNDSARIKIHQTKHVLISAHKCSYCTYSSDSKGALTLHLKRQHSTGSPARKRQNKCYYECQFCDFETHDAANMRAHDTRHQRNLEFECSRCNYSASLLSAVKKHENSQHRKLEPTAASVAPKKKAPFKDVKKHMLNCQNCHYSTDNYKKMDDHIEAHQGKGKLKCPRCSFSSNVHRNYTRHLKRHHTQEESEDECPKNEDEKMEPALKKKKVNKSRAPEEEMTSATVEDRKEKEERATTTLHELETEEAKCLKILSSYEAAIESDHLKMDEIREKMTEEVEKKADKISSLRKRLGVMQEKVRKADKAFKEVGFKLESVRGEISQVAEQKRTLETNLRTLKAKGDVVGIKLFSLQYGSPAARREEDRVIEEINRCTEKMAKVDILLKSLVDQEEILLEDFEIEEGSFNGVSHVVESMEAELLELESSSQGSSSLQEQLDELTISLDNKMAKYSKVDNRFFEIKKLKKVELSKGIPQSL